MLARSRGIHCIYDPPHTLDCDACTGRGATALELADYVASGGAAPVGEG